MEHLIEGKVAIIFHGIVGGMDDRNGVGLPINIYDCSRTIKHNLLSRYDCDIFIHSWSLGFKDELISLYNPVSSLFQEQEYFNFKPHQIGSEVRSGQEFRSISKYTSMLRANSLKQKYENENGFKYQWVIVLRFDLIFLNVLNISTFDNQFFYTCYNPQWGTLDKTQLIHDIIFLSNSILMDEYCEFGNELQSKLYDGSDIHKATYNKIMRMFNNDHNMIKFGIRLYEDIEHYRGIFNPNSNPLGCKQGLLEMKTKLELLLQTI